MPIVVESRAFFEARLRRPVISPSSFFGYRSEEEQLVAGGGVIPQPTSIPISDRLSPHLHEILSFRRRAIEKVGSKGEGGGNVPRKSIPVWERRECVFSIQRTSGIRSGDSRDVGKEGEIYRAPRRRKRWYVVRMWVNQIMSIVSKDVRLNTSCVVRYGLKNLATAPIPMRIRHVTVYCTTTKRKRNN